MTRAYTRPDRRPEPAITRCERCHELIVRVALADGQPARPGRLCAGCTARRFPTVHASRGTLIEVTG